jgi:hypothetical protein
MLEKRAGSALVIDERLHFIPMAVVITVSNEQDAACRKTDG